MLGRDFCNHSSLIGKHLEIFLKVKREGPYVYQWLVHVDIWQKTTKFCKAIILQLKKMTHEKNKLKNGKNKYSF